MTETLIQKIEALKSPYDDSYVLRCDVLKIIREYHFPNGKKCIMNLSDEQFDKAWSAISQEHIGLDPEKFLIKPEQFYEECVIAAIRPLLSNIALPYDNFSNLSAKEHTLREVAKAAIEAIKKEKP
jgi:hypothetical protein